MTSTGPTAADTSDARRQPLGVILNGCRTVTIRHVAVSAPANFPGAALQAGIETIMTGARVRGERIHA